MKGSKTVTYNPNVQEYVVKLRKPNWWWLLLLLLPLLLLILQIRIPAKINVGVYDKSTQQSIQNISVFLTYPDRNFIDFAKFKFFTRDTLQKTSITDQNGKTTFNVSYTLYHRIFHSKDDAYLSISGNCAVSTSLTDRYFSMIRKRENQLFSSILTKPYNFIVVESKTKQPIPNADVEITSKVGNFTSKSTYKSDVRGIVEATIPQCSEYIDVIASKYGYTPYQTSGNLSHFNNSDNRILPLSEKFSPIEFFVKDLKTRQPIPNAKATLYVSDAQITEITNVDGLGKGMFDSLSLTKSFKIQFTHPAYYDTITRVYTVDEYTKLSQEQRTFYMRPRPGNVSFWNTEKTTGNPLEGVKNQVYVNGQYKGEYFSNSNGEFVVPGLNPEDNISITASKPGYKTNDYTIKNKRVENLDTKQKRTIPLELDDTPQNTEPPKENCRVHFSGTLLSDVYMEGHISKIYEEDQYGEYVGEGEYPYAKTAFPKADRTTFDAIAIDKGTRLIIYSEPFFKGSIILDVTGPALINNVKWKDDERIKDVNRKTFTQPLETLFPKSCRRWSHENMHGWSRGSIKIICNQ